MDSTPAGVGGKEISNALEAGVGAERGEGVAFLGPGGRQRRLAARPVQAVASFGGAAAVQGPPVALAHKAEHVIITGLQLVDGGKVVQVKVAETGHAPTGISHRSVTIHSKVLYPASCLSHTLWTSGGLTPGFEKKKS